MAANQKKRQKKLERRAAKRKDRRRELIRQKNRGLGELLAMASAAPVLHSRIGDTVQDEGLGQVLLSRLLPNNRVAMVVFLVDRYCLGVKDCFGRLTVRAEYDSFCKEMDDKFEMEDYKPADVRKLVEGAVSYARNLGLEPHPDYHRVKAIFGDIDVGESKMEFEFGSDGKPLFINGPHDSPERCRRIISILQHSCGPGGFHFIMGGPTGMKALEGEDDDFEDDDDGYEDEDDGYEPPAPGVCGDSAKYPLRSPAFSKSRASFPASLRSILCDRKQERLQCFRHSVQLRRIVLQQRVAPKGP